MPQIQRHKAGYFLQAKEGESGEGSWGVNAGRNDIKYN